MDDEGNGDVFADEGPGIADGGRERQRVTINDVARLAQVSKKTVSRVINDSALVHPDTRAKVEAVIRDLGFSPDPQARALALRRSFLIGMVYDNPSPQYIVHLQRGILDAIEDTSFQLVLRPCDRGAPDLLARLSDFVTRHRPFGVVLPPSLSEDDRVAELLRRHDCAYVRIASASLDDPERMITTRDEEGAAQAARHLAALGHKRIAHVRGPETFRSSHARLAGFSAGLAEFGLELDPALTLEGAYTFESGVRNAEKLLYGKNRPTAVFAGNDEMAIGIYQAVRRAGQRIPEDISIVGYDDTPMAARVWPPMTTVRLPIRDMGKAAADVLLERVRVGGELAPRTFLPEIVVRESTARPHKD